MLAAVVAAVRQFCPEGQAERLHVWERDVARPGEEPRRLRLVLAPRDAKLKDIDLRAEPYGDGALLVGVFGATLFYGDSVITPAISVLGAMEGLQVATPALQHWVLPLSLAVLALFVAYPIGVLTWNALLDAQGVNVLASGQAVSTMKSCGQCHDAGETYLGYGETGAVFWTLKAEHPVVPDSQSGLHICFKAKSREMVDRFYRAALSSGGKDNGAPGLRPHYHPNYYAAFVLDPDGHRIEAVCHGAA